MSAKRKLARRNVRQPKSPQTHICEPETRPDIKVGDVEIKHAHPYCKTCGRAMK